MEPSRTRSLAAGLVLALAVVACSTATPPKLSASRSKVAIGALVTQGVAGTVTITNNGGSQAEVELSVVGSPWLSASPASAKLGPGQGLDVTVSGQCGVPGTHQANLVVATTDGKAGVSVALELSCDLGVDSDFDIEIEFIGTAPTPEVRAVFEAAAARWSQVIVGDLPSITFPVVSDDVYLEDYICEPGQPDIRGRTIDDVLIFAKVGPIDGQGNVLGSAGPCFVRTAAPTLTVIGVMVFDSADLASMQTKGTLQEVILHEMGHVLGVGTLWKSAGLLDGVCDANDPMTVRRFIGAEANLKHVEAGGAAGQLVVESDGGRGTACGHWDEEAYQTELMTGFIGAAGNPLSAITAGSLADLGYDVVYDMVDDYTVPGPSALRGETAGLRIVEELRQPIGFLGE